MIIDDGPYMVFLGGSFAVRGVRIIYVDGKLTRARPKNIPPIYTITQVNSVLTERLCVHCN